MQTPITRGLRSLVTNPNDGNPWETKNECYHLGFLPSHALHWESMIIRRIPASVESQKGIGILRETFHGHAWRYQIASCSVHDDLRSLVALAISDR